MAKKFDCLKDTIKRDGFAFFKKCEPEVSTEELLPLFARPEFFSDKGPVHKLVPKKCQGLTPNTYSGIYGLDCFPLHTDLAHWEFPPRYFILRCISGIKTIETKLLDSKTVLSILGKDCFANEIVMPRKSTQGLRRALSLFDQSRNLFRWDKSFLKPCLKSSRFEEIAECISTTPTIKVSLSEHGDLLVVDNWRMLHGRGRVPKSGLDRVIERAYIRELL